MIVEYSLHSVCVERLKLKVLLSYKKPTAKEGFFVFVVAMMKHIKDYLRFQLMKEQKKTKIAVGFFFPPKQQ